MFKDESLPEDPLSFDIPHENTDIEARIVSESLTETPIRTEEVRAPDSHSEERYSSSNGTFSADVEKQITQAPPRQDALAFHEAKPIEQAKANELAFP